MTDSPPDISGWRVYDKVLSKFVAGAFERRSKADRQLGHILKSGKYPYERFVVLAITASGEPIDERYWMEIPELEAI